MRGILISVVVLGVGCSSESREPKRALLETAAEFTYGEAVFQGAATLVVETKGAESTERLTLAAVNTHESSVWSSLAGAIDLDGVVQKHPDGAVTVDYAANTAEYSWVGQNRGSFSLVPADSLSAEQPTEQPSQFDPESVDAPPPEGDLGFTEVQVAVESDFLVSKLSLSIDPTGNFSAVLEGVAEEDVDHVNGVISGASVRITGRGVIMPSCLAVGEDGRIQFDPENQHPSCSHLLAGF